MEDRTLDFDPEAEELARSASLGSLPTRIPSIPGYRLDEILGEGSFGEVWAGIQLSTGQKVAVKTLHKTDLGAVTYLQNEVSRLANLGEHPHVLTLIDANLTNVPAFLVTPRLQDSLDKHLSGEASIAQVCEWMQDVAGALVFIHSRGILHCDLKPANLLLDREGRVRVVDFGQAHLLEQAGVSLGTLWFMPPEQVPMPGYRPIPEVSWDIYAWGATVYCLLTGRNPRQSEQADATIRTHDDARKQLEEYRRMLRVNPLQPVRSLNPKVDRDLAAIVERALDINAEVRYRSAADILADLSRRRRRVPVLARPQSSGYLARRFVARNWLLCLFCGLSAGALAWSRVELVRSRHLSAHFRSEAEAAQALAEEQTGDLRGLLHLADAIEVDPSNLAARWCFNSLLDTHLRSGIQLTGNGSQGLVTPRGLLLYVNPGASRVSSYSPGGSSLFSFEMPFVERCVLSDDGRWLVGLGAPGAIHVQDLRLANGAPSALVKLVSKSQSPTVCACISNAGEASLCGCQDGSVTFFSGGQEVRTWQHQGAVSAVLISKDGRWGASAGQDGRVDLQDLSSGRELRRWNLGAPVIGLEWGERPGDLVVGCANGTIAGLSATGAVSVWQRGSSLQGLHRAPNGKILSWSGGTCRIWSNQGKLVHELDCSFPISCSQLSESGDLLVTGHDNGLIQLWDTRSEQLAAARVARNVRVRDVGFLPGIEGIFTVTSALETWSYRGVVPPPLAMRQETRIAQMIWDPKSRWLATRDASEVQLWGPDGRPLGQPLKRPGERIQLQGTARGDLLFLCSHKGGSTVERWRVDPAASTPLTLEQKWDVDDYFTSSSDGAWGCTWKARPADSRNQKTEIRVMALSEGGPSLTGAAGGAPKTWTAEVGLADVVLAFPSDDGQRLAAVTSDAHGLQLGLWTEGRAPQTVPGVRQPLFLRLTPSGILLGTGKACFLYGPDLKVLWSHPYPGHIEPSRSSSSAPQEWLGYQVDRQARTLVCVGMLQSDWLEVKTGRVIRHIDDGRNGNACLSDDGSWLCLLGNPGATLYRANPVVASAPEGRDFVAQPAGSGPMGLTKGIFRPDGGALTLCEDRQARSFPLPWEPDVPASKIRELAEARTGRFLQNGLMYRSWDPQPLRPPPSRGRLPQPQGDRGAPGKQE